MTFADILGAFSFGQLVALLLLIIVPTIGVIVYLSLNGLSLKRHNTTIQLGQGKTVKVSRGQMYNVVLLLEALKTKDDITRIDTIIFKRQRRKAKELAVSLRDSLLEAFRDALMTVCDFSDDQYEGVLSNRDYLYFSLLSDKIQSRMLYVIVGDFESNGLATKANPDYYAHSRSEVVIEELRNILNAMFLGISEEPRDSFMKTFEVSCGSYKNRIQQLYREAVEISQQGQEKKVELESYLFEKVGEMEGISKDQFKKLFNRIESDDFLDL